MNPIAFIKSKFTDPTTEIPPPMQGEIGWEESNLYRSKDFPKYNPDILISNKGAGIYRKMKRDDQVKAALQFKQHAVISRDYYFKVGVDENKKEIPEHVEMADFFNAMVDQIEGSFDDNLLGILSGLDNGFSITEKVYTPIEWQEKSYWGVKNLKLRPFDSFDGGFIIDDHGNIEKLNQDQAGQPVEIPMEKVIHFVHQPDIDAQYGESDMRACYRDWWSKDIAIKFQNIHLERHASGFVYAQVTGSLGTVEKTNLRNLLNNISARMSAQIPESVKLDSIQPLSTDAFRDAISGYNTAISRSILMPNLLGLAEQGPHGSKALGETQLKAFFWILDAIASRLAQALNDQMFLELALWNFGTKDFPPFTFEPISDEQKIALAKAWTEMVKGGSVSKSDSDEAHLRNLIGFPEKVEEEIEPEEISEDIPEEMPDNDEWVNAQPFEKAEFIQQEFQDKPWVKRVNFSRLEKTLDRQDAIFVAEMNDIMAKTKISIDKQVTKVAGDKSFGNVKPNEILIVKMPPGLVSQLRKVVRTNLKVVYDDGTSMAQKELPKKKHQRIGPGMDKVQAEKYLSSKAMKIAGVVDKDVLKAVQIQLENAIKYDSTLAETIRALAYDTELMKLLPEVDAAGRAVNIPARLENIARTNTSDAVNQARMTVFGDPDLKGFVQSYEYSAILDDRTTEVCEALNGRIRRDWTARTPPNHFMCRSILIPVTTVDNWNGKEDKIPVAGIPHAGFGKEQVEAKT